MGKPDDRTVEMMRVSQEKADEMSRRTAKNSSVSAGLMSGPGEEKLLSVKLHDECPHSKEHWIPKPCGHCFC